MHARARTCTHARAAHVRAHSHAHARLAMLGANVIPGEIRWKPVDSEGGEEDQRAEQEHAGHVGQRIKPAGQEQPTIATPGRTPHGATRTIAHTPHTRGWECKHRVAA
eukprot:9243630-Alexandrium_andersonii.AAC.1